MGMEQVASHFLVVRDPKGIVLPYRRYCNFGGEPLMDEAAFVHFLGTFRYDQDTYRRIARQSAARMGDFSLCAETGQPRLPAIAAE